MQSTFNLLKQIYYRLHAWFTWLLRVAGRNWTPVDLKCGPVDEDEAIAEERSKRTNQHSFTFDDTLASGSVTGSVGSSGTVTAVSSGVETVDPTTLSLGYELGWTDGTPEVETAV